MRFCPASAVIPSPLVVAPLEAKLIGTVPPIVPAVVGVKLTDIAVLLDAPAAKLVMIPPFVVSCELVGVPKAALSPS